MEFTKMHGIGNDYVYVNCFKENIENPEVLSVKISDRHFGVGSDGLILICPSERADFEMKMYNADGSKSQMCGNGIRCVGKYVYDKGLTQKEIVSVESGGEIKILKLNIKDGTVASVQVDMGAPVLKPKEIPLNAEGENFINKEIEVGGKTYNCTCVSMGNPHAVIYIDNVDALDIEKIGPLFENHPMFPERINTEFVEVIDNKTLKMRVWERGSGETLACGTGACAVLVSSVLNGYSDREAKICLLGGELSVKWNEKDNHVYKTGPAAFVFDGTLSKNF